MRTHIIRHSVFPLLAIIALTSSVSVHAWSGVGHKWATTSISYYVNPQSLYVSPNAAISAVQQAAAGWSQQSRANVQLVYAGTTTGTSLTMNRKNEVFFRNGSNGGNVAETYYWWDATGTLVDADIVFYEGSYRFYAGSGCSAGIYVEDVAIHEFGHVLGIGHTAVSGATMAPAMASYCDSTQLTLESDDIAAIESVYPPLSGSAPTTGTGGTAGCTAPPPTPTGFTGSRAAGVANVRWDSVTGAASYLVQAGSVPNGANIFSGSLNATAASGALDGSIPLFVRVSAENACGRSAPTPDLALPGGGA